MSTDFPDAIDTFPTAEELVDDTLATNPHSTLHGNLGDALEAVEAITVGPAVFNVKGYGAVGDNSTDDTAAFNAAIAAAVAASTAPAQGATVFVPPGVYRVGALTTITSAGIRILGAGHHTSYITATATTLFTLGTFSSAPSDYYGGGGDHFTVEHLTLNGDEYAVAAGSRTRRAITANGSGNISLNNVHFFGWQYGLKGNYGSDNDRFDDCVFEYCDVGVFLGYGSDKAYLTAVEFFACREGLVLDNLSMWNATACIFTGCSLSSIQIEWLTAPRGGLATQPYDTISGKIDIDGCWFESLPSGSSPTNGHIHLYHETQVSYPRGVHVNDAFVIGGGSGTNTPFVYAETGSHIVVSDCVIFGTEISSAVKRGTNAHYLRQIRTRITDGTTAVMWENRDSTCSTELAEGLILTFTSADTTPSVGTGPETAYAYSNRVFKAASTSSVTITVFDDGYIGQRITVMSANGNTSFANGSGILTRTAGTVTLGTNSCTAFVYDGANWYQEF